MLKDSIDLHRQGRLDDAERGYREHLAEQPNDAEAMHLLALVRRQRGANDEAEQLLTRAHQLAPDVPHIELTLGTLRFESGDFDAARAHYERALALDPNIGGAHAGIGQLALMRGERDVAESHFRIALRTGEDAQALAGLGALLLEKGDVDAALRHLGRAADLVPNDPMIQVTLGRAFALRGTDSFAEKAFENALRVQPELAVARHALASLTLKGKRFREAESHYRRLLDVAGAESSGYVGLGDVARAEERDQDAVDAYRAALAIEPVQSAPSRALAWSLMRLGRVDEGIAAYDAYLERAPDDHDVRVARAEFLMLTNRLHEASADWSAIAARNPADMQAHARLALIDEYLGRFDAASAEAELVLRARPDEPEMQLIRIRALMRQGDDGAARMILDALAGRPLSEGQHRLRLNYLARLHDRAGEYADAARLFAEAQRGTRASMPALDVPNPALEIALTEPSAEHLADAPVLLIGAPGSGVERVAALLADQAGLTVLRDRIGGAQRDDDFTNPNFEQVCGPLDEAARASIRERWLAPLRAAGIASDRAVVDWLPRWDAHLLALVRRAFPGTRLVVVHRDVRDELLNWLAFGWLPGFPCSDLEFLPDWLARARDHLDYADALEEPRRFVVDADALLADPVGNGAGLARFLGIEAIEPGRQFAGLAVGLGGLPVQFPRGHWEHYREALALPFERTRSRL
jgi:tetratricopeptide (TPR) repeat protein